jgi:hypothetical protein
MPKVGKVVDLPRGSGAQFGVKSRLLRRDKVREIVAMFHWSFKRGVVGGWLPLVHCQSEIY